MLTNFIKEYFFKFLDHIEKYQYVYIYNFCGACFLIFVFCNRVILEKLPKDLNTFYLYLFITSIVMIIIQIFHIIQLSKLILDFGAEKRRGFFSYHKKKIRIIYKKIRKKYMHKEDLIAIPKLFLMWNLSVQVPATYCVLLSY